MKKTILIVDDEQEIINSLYRLLRRFNYNILQANNAIDGLKLLETNKVHLIISDQRMPKMSGCEFFSIAKDLYPETLRIILSGYTDIDNVVNAVNNGQIYKFFTKPWNNRVLAEEVSTALSQQILVENFHTYKNLFDTALEAIIVFNENGVVEQINTAFLQYTYYVESDCIGKNIDVFSHHNKPLDIVKELTVRGTNEYQSELLAKRKDDSTFPAYVTIIKISTNLNAETKYAALFVDITVQKEREEMLRYYSYHDTLTGLTNREYFDDQLKIALLQARKAQIKIGLILVDIDRFRQINDTFGEKNGNEILKLFAYMLEKQIGSDMIISRQSADEFAVLIPYFDKTLELENICESILTTLTTPLTVSENNICISVSIGISTYPVDSKDIDSMYQHAHHAMCSAKKLGGNCYAFYSESMNAKTKAMMLLEHDLKDALKKDHLEVYYQPKYNIQDNKFEGFEALIRWNHPDNGLIMPDVFIPVSEERGLISEIGNWVVRAVCKQISCWSSSGNNKYRISINVSPIQLNEMFFDFVVETLNVFNLTTASIELEITEGIFMDDNREAISILEKFHNIGIVISLDDFGTGYSSLKYLKDYRFQVIKIDQAFIRTMTKEPINSALVSSIINLAREMEMCVVAEGVETESQLDMLKSMGCNVAQGYYVAKPLQSFDAYNYLSKYK